MESIVTGAILKKNSPSRLRAKSRFRCLEKRIFFVTSEIRILLDTSSRMLVTYALQRVLQRLHVVDISARDFCKNVELHGFLACSLVAFFILKCWTMLAKIRVVTRGDLFAVEDVEGGSDNTPFNPFSPNLSKIFVRSLYESPRPAIFSTIEEDFSQCLYVFHRIMSGETFVEKLLVNRRLAGFDH